jgi:hypothetical protein
MKHAVLLFVLFLLIFSACDINGPEQNSEFAIYLLEDKSITKNNTPWDEFVDQTLDDTPFLSSENIDMYDWSSHLIYLKTNKSYLQDFFFDSTYGLRYNGCPFIVTGGTQLLYSGLVYHSYHGVVIQWPKISTTELSYYPDDIFGIGRPYGNCDDPRSLPEVKEALIEAGIFHAGVNVELDTSFGVFFHSISGDTMEVEYRISITNLDQEALYVLDPDKSDGWMFNYFTSPPVFYDSLDTPQIRSSSYYKGTAPDTSDYDNLDYYTLLLPGQSIKRSLLRGTYTNVQAGNYYIKINYGAPLYTMTRLKRNKLFGRIWIGVFNGKKYNVSIQADCLTSE